MEHSHTHRPRSYNTSFAMGISLNMIFVGVELVYGLSTHSLSLVADAGHNFSDVIGLILAWLAAYLTGKKSSSQFTYGLKGSSIMAAFGNAVLLLIAIGGIAWESIQRFSHPQAVSGSTVMAVAGIGILVNAATAALFFKGRKEDLNLKGAYLHMFADTLVSLGVVVSGFIMNATGLFWIDPLMSLLICFVILVSTWELFMESLRLSLSAVPKEIKLGDVAAFIKSRKEVTSVHDLHIWALSTTETALTAHVLTPDGHPGDKFVHELNHELEEKFGIHHSTIQVELGQTSCEYDGKFCQK